MSSDSKLLRLPTTPVRVLLALGAVVSALLVASCIMQILMLSREYTEAEGVANESRMGGLVNVDTGVYWVTVVVFGRWIYLAQRNVRALGARGLTHTPGWAVGIFLLPIVSLWMPYTAMKQLWQASYKPSSWHDIKRSGVLPLWWTLWIAVGSTGTASYFLWDHAQDIESYIFATYVDIGSQLLMIALCLAASVLVGQVAKAQSEAAPPRPTDSDRHSGGTQNGNA